MITPNSGIASFHAPKRNKLTVPSRGIILMLVQKHETTRDAANQGCCSVQLTATDFGDKPNEAKGSRPCSLIG